MRVELIYGHSPEEIFIRKLHYSRPPTVEQVILDSKVLEIYKLDLKQLSACIFTEKASLDKEVKDGDRISLLRPLKRARQQAPAREGRGKSV